MHRQYTVLIEMKLICPENTLKKLQNDALGSKTTFYDRYVPPEPSICIRITKTGGTTLLNAYVRIKGLFTSFLMIYNLCVCIFLHHCRPNFETTSS